MTQEHKQRHRRDSEFSVYPESHLGSVLYGKRPRMLEDESKASLGEAREKGRRALVMAGRVLLFPFLAIYSLGAALFKRLKLSSRDKKPIATVLVPYYKPQINTSGIAATFTAADATGDIALDDFGRQPLLRRLSVGRNRRKAHSLHEEIFNTKGKRTRKVRWVAVITSLFIIAMGAGYGGWWYSEGRYSVVTIDDNGSVSQVRTADETVADVLAASNIQLGEDDVLSMHPSTEIREGLNVGIVRAKSVTIGTKEGETTVELAQGTVSDALARANIAYDEDDEISPSLDTELSEGLHIKKVDVEVAYETKTEEIPFKEVYQDSNSLYVGKSKVEVEGENGEKSIKERVVIRDGAEAAREIIATNIEKEPVNKVILNGTKIEVVELAPQVASSGGSGGSKASSGSSGGGKTSNSSSGGGSSNSGSGGGGSSGGSSKPAPAGGPSADQIAKEMTVDFITAYTHTGQKTSTGSWPAVGMCAVNPNHIPYGTRLYIPGYGYAVAADTGSFTKGRNAIDVFLDTEAACRQWGRKHSVTVYILK